MIQSTKLWPHTAYSKGFVAVSRLLRRSSGLASAVASPVVSLNAMYMYRWMALPARSSTSACMTCRWRLTFVSKLSLSSGSGIRANFACTPVDMQHLRRRL